MSTDFFITINEEVVDIASRSNGGYISIKNPLVLLLDDGIVLENDNSPGGIETVGDLKSFYTEQEEKYGNYQLNHFLMKIILFLLISFNLSAINLESEKYLEGKGSLWDSEIDIKTKIIFDNDRYSKKYNSFTIKSENKPQFIITINDSLNSIKSSDGTINYEYRCTTNSGGFCDMIISIKNNRYTKIKIKFSDIEKIYKIKF